MHRMLESLSSDMAVKLARVDTEAVAAAVNKGKEKVIEEALWVDRYRPSKFTELMGNERVARETMAWVKQWDWCVFGKKKGKKRAREEDEDSLMDPNDEYHRPRDKVSYVRFEWDT